MNSQFCHINDTYLCNTNGMQTKIPLLNRELGVLEFNSRVLAQAEDPKTPLLERLRFVCIVSSNMDEFFEIRMSGLKEQLKSNSKNKTPDGLSITEAYKVVTAQAHEQRARGGERKPGLEHSS